MACHTLSPHHMILYETQTRLPLSQESIWGPKASGAKTSMYYLAVLEAMGKVGPAMKGAHLSKPFKAR